MTLFSVEKRALTDGSAHSHDGALLRDFEVFLKSIVRYELWITFNHKRFIIENVSSDVYFGVRILTLNSPVYEDGEQKNNHI